MKKIVHSARRGLLVHVRNAPRLVLLSGTGILAVVLVAPLVWFYTPAPTSVARFVWGQYHAGEIALVLDRTDANLAFAIGDYYFGNQSTISKANKRPYDLPFAEKAFGKARAIDPSVRLAHYMLARIEFVHADFNTALINLDTELSLYPENKRTLYMRALAYAYRDLPGDLLLAEQDFREFIVWAPREWAGYNDLAFVLAKEKKYLDAAKVLKEGIAKAEDGATNLWLWDALGVMELNLNNPAQAVSALIKAQNYAVVLTEIDWQRAYPGNNPSMAPQGIEAIRRGILKNILKAYAALGK